MKTTRPLPTSSAWTGTNNAALAGITRGYSAEDVVRLRGTVHVEHSLARLGAEKLWSSLHGEPFVNALGALTGNQAMQQVKAGLKAIYLSGWQVAADANLAGEMYPDQSLYPANSVPQVVKRINNTLLRADQLHHAEGERHRLPAADRGRCRGRLRRRAERLRADEGDDRGRRRRRALRGPAGLGEEVRPHGRQGAGADARGGREAGRRAPRRRRLRRADRDRGAHRCRERRPADVRRRRTTSRSAPASAPSKASSRPATASTRRSAAAWPTRPMPTWSGARPASRTSRRRKFAEAIHAKFPGKLLAYNCSPSFNWKKNLDDATIAKFQKELAAMGYKFQFITLAGFHALNYGMFELAHGYKRAAR
jgi:isocitrate lyase